MLKAIRIILLGVLLLFLCLCKAVWINTSKDNDSSVATSVGQLKIQPTDISGWQDDNASPPYAIFTSATLREAIDGGDGDFINHGGLIAGGIQSMMGANGKRIRSFSMDYGDQETALWYFQNLTSSITVRIHIPNYSDSIAVFDAGGGGTYTVFAYFKKFFFKLQLTSFQDESDALETAALFLDIYSSKIY
jgi:hypothetical protein